MIMMKVLIGICWHTCGKQLHDGIILLTGQIWTDKSSLTPSLFIDEPVSKQVMYMCVRKMYKNDGGVGKPG
jgi:hypothetical protein